MNKPQAVTIDRQITTTEPGNTIEHQFGRRKVVINGHAITTRRVADAALLVALLSEPKAEAAEQPGEKPHLSISALNMLSRCGEQYRRRYLEGEKIPPGIAALVGRGVDASVSTNMLSKMHDKVLLPLEQLTDVAADKVKNEFEAGEVLLTDEEAEDPSAALAKAVDKSVRLSTVHSTELAEIIEPVSVQKKWLLEIDGFPFDLLGFSDIEEADAIRDIKTAAKSLAKDAAHTSNQLTLYSMAKTKAEGKIPNFVALDALIDTKVPKAQVLTSKRGVTDFQVMLNRVEQASEAITKEIFVPANQDDWWCHPKFCGYFNSCKYARASARPQT